MRGLNSSPPNPANPHAALHTKALSHVLGAEALGIPSLSAWCTFLLQERAWRCNWAAGELRGLQLGCGTWVVSALPARPEPAADLPAAPAGLGKPGAITGSGGAQSTQQAAGARPRAPCPACTAQVPTTSLFAWAGTALPAPPPVRFLHRYPRFQRSPLEGRPGAPPGGRLPALSLPSSGCMSTGLRCPLNAFFCDYLGIKPSATLFLTFFSLPETGFHHEAVAGLELALWTKPV